MNRRPDAPAPTAGTAEDPVDGLFRTETTIPAPAVEDVPSEAELSRWDAATHKELFDQATGPVSLPPPPAGHRSEPPPAPPALGQEGERRSRTTPSPLPAQARRSAPRVPASEPAIELDASSVLSDELDTSRPPPGPDVAALPKVALEPPPVPKTSRASKPLAAPAGHSVPPAAPAFELPPLPGPAPTPAAKAVKAPTRLVWGGLVGALALAGLAAAWIFGKQHQEPEGVPPTPASAPVIPPMPPAPAPKSAALPPAKPAVSLPPLAAASQAVPTAVSPPSVTSPAPAPTVPAPTPTPEAPTAPAPTPAVGTPVPKAPSQQAVSATPGPKAAEAEGADEAATAVALARKKLADDDAQGAEALMRGLLVTQPRNFYAMEVLARALIDQDRGADAAAVAAKVVQFRPRRVPYWLLLGDALLMKGDQAGAQNAWRKALELAPADPGAKQRLGM